MIETPAGDVVRQIVAEAEDILRTALPAMVTDLVSKPDSIRRQPRALTPN